MALWALALAAALMAATLLALAVVAMIWAASLARALRRRGGASFDWRLPEPLPLPPHVRADLSSIRRAGAGEIAGE